MTSRVECSYNYAVLSLIIDETRAITIPMGVVLWCPESQWVNVRLVNENEPRNH